MPAVREEVTGLLCQAVREVWGFSVPIADMEATLEMPREEKFGDLTTNIALCGAREKGKPSRPAAEELAARLESLIQGAETRRRIARVAVEGPGFINFYYSAEEIAGVLARIRKEGESFGRPRGIRKKNILLEFVSANPTGPLTVAHGRQAALGDSLASILKFCGHRVSKEYYNNDEGAQIQMLGRSLRSRYLTEIGVANEFPQNGYQGDYLRELAVELASGHGQSLTEKDEIYFARVAREQILKGIQKDLSDFGVGFDNYFSQEALARSGRVEKALEHLRLKGFVYEKDGAVWFASTRLGDDKDRVLVKSDKSYTYLMPDIAYHEDKFSRGYDFLVTILGPDHHGYIPRIKAAVEALGYSRDALQILIAQLVTLFEGAEALRMSTRAGEFITLRQTLEEVGKDAGRFFFLMRKFDAHLDFDLSLAKSQTPDNPVFYIQYAHARIESLKSVFRAGGGALHEHDESCVRRLSDPLEIRLMRLLSQFEEVVLAAERTLEPYRLVPYLRELAGSFHRFYTDHRVVTQDADLTQARFRLVTSVQAVLRSGLGLLGVSAPLKM